MKSLDVFDLERKSGAGREPLRGASAKCFESGNVSSSKTPQEHPLVFEERFWRCRDALFFVAYRVLGSAKGAAEAVENCFRKASRNSPRFESDGAFGSWALRILIDEALVAREQKKSRAKTCSK